MKALAAAAAIFYSVNAFAVFASLEKEWIKDGLKYCQYTNKVIITIKTFELCPLSIE